MVPTAPGFNPNFSSDYSVIVNHPIAEVFLTIGTAKGHERVTRLAELTTACALQKADAVAIPQSLTLSEVAVRTLPDHHNFVPPVRKLPRQFWTLTETIPLIFGLARTEVHIAGTLTWDDEAKLALYESLASFGVLVWKLRVFEEIDENTTRITEKIRGKCPFLLKGIVQRQASASHVYVYQILRTDHS